MAQATGPALLTGEAYLESLRDGRTVYIDGEQRRRRHHAPGVPQLRPLDRTALRRAPRPAASATSLLGVDRHGITTHKFFMPSYSAEELLAAREAIAAWARMSYGFMGRTPDYKASFMATLGAAPEFYAPFEASAEAWYRRYARAGALPQPRADQPADRPQPRGARGRGRVRARREGARRRDGRLRRQDARDRLGADARHVRRSEQRGPAREGEGRGLRARVHRADGHARKVADLSALLRARRLVAVGQPALEPLRRERRRRRLRRGVHPVGERARLPRRREGDRLLSPPPAS